MDVLHQRRFSLRSQKQEIIPQITQITQMEIRSLPFLRHLRNLRNLRLISLLCCFAVGCHSPRHLRPPTTAAVSLALEEGLSTPTQNTDVQAIVAPPLHWKIEPLKSSPQHKHQIWLSPSGNTAYGIIFFQLPWPVGPDLALTGFLQQMKQSEGAANLISKEDAKNFPGIRFVAEGGQYRIRGNMIVNGFDGWVVYAGTLLKNPVDYAELQSAEQAREQTLVAGQTAD